MTNWQYGNSESFSGVLNAVDLSFTLSRKVICLDLQSSQKKAGWNKAGDIIQVIDLELVDNFFTRLEVSDSFSYLGFNPTLFRFNIANGNQYRLRFKPVPWLTDFTIIVWEYYGL